MRRRWLSGCFLLVNHEEVLPACLGSGGGALRVGYPEGCACATDKSGQLFATASHPLPGLNAEAAVEDLLLNAGSPEVDGLCVLHDVERI